MQPSPNPLHLTKQRMALEVRGLIGPVFKSSQEAADRAQRGDCIRAAGILGDAYVEQAPFSDRWPR